MKILFALGAVLLVSFAGLSAWLLNPFDQQSWRFSVNAPQLKRQVSILGVSLRNYKPCSSGLAWRHYQKPAQGLAARVSATNAGC